MFRSLAFMTVLILTAACAVPGRLYQTSPHIEGRVTSAGHAVVDGEVELTVRHTENARLRQRFRARLDELGRFAFPAAEFAVAGQEYDKRYEIYLHLVASDKRDAIWKFEYSRLELGEPVRLRCALEREPTEGLPCRVVGDTRLNDWILETGARDYRRYCASCHGRDARGDGPASAGLATTPPDLTRIAARRGGDFPAAEIAAWIDGRLTRSHGSNEMPIWGTRLAEEFVPGEFAEALARGRVDTIVSFLESIQRSTADE